MKLSDLSGNSLSTQHLKDKLLEKLLKAATMVDVNPDPHTGETGCSPDEEECVHRVGTIIYCLEQEFLFYDVPVLHVVCNHVLFP